MKYLLDTGICIYLIKRRSAVILKHFKKSIPGDIGISMITLSELAYGVEKSQSRERNLAALEEFLIPLEIVPLSLDAAFHYGKIRAVLEKKGKPIGAMDLLIGAQALALSATLVTNNVREFSRIAGLQIENWASEAGHP